MHVIAAAKVMQSINPTESVAELAKMIVVNYIRLPRIDDQDNEKCDDGVYLYAIELLSLGLLWHGFHDAIREGDGERILRYWNFFWYSLSQRTIAIMRKKQSTCYSSITTNFQKGRELSSCGAVVSTQGAILEPTFHVICSWNI